MFVTKRRLPEFADYPQSPSTRNSNGTILIVNINDLFREAALMKSYFPINQSCDPHRGHHTNGSTRSEIS